MQPLGKKSFIDNQRTEIVERKGIGHPDSLADGISELFSIKYSKFCASKFGRILNHWVDKCILIGGEAKIAFNYGKIIKPIEVYIVGKATQALGKVKVPISEIAYNSITAHMKKILPMLNVDKDLKIFVRTSDAIGTGRDEKWYRPISIDDLKELDNPKANDSVACTSYAPLSVTEKITLLIERYLNSKEIKRRNPEIGADIKVLALRIKNRLHLTICIPFISSLTPSREFYLKRKHEISLEIKNLVKEFAPQFDIKVYINTRDTSKNMYLTVTGTAADCGDCGVVGRGNRIGGIIPITREMGIEASCGKNPVYHSGKIYNVLAYKISQDIYDQCGLRNYVNIVGQAGRQIKNPYFIIVKPLAENFNKEEIEEIVIKNVNEAYQITDEILDGLVYYLTLEPECYPMNEWLKKTLREWGK